MSTRTRNRLGIALGLAFGVVVGTASVSPANAYTQSVIHPFCPGGSCTDGSAPQGPVLKKGARFYGTATTGGAHNGGGVWRYNSNNSNYTVLYSFCTTSGCPNTPSSDVIIDTSGNLYGTALNGGANGGGAVWELVKPATGSAYTFVDLYDFCATTSGSICTDGKAPHGLTYEGAAAGSDYNGSDLLYGTTSSGGSADDGTVFAMQLSGGTWSEKVIHSFTGTTSDGKSPTEPWVDASNNIWGTTGSGGSQNKGAAYELTPGANPWTSAWTETIVFNFCWQGLGHCPEGSGPSALMLDGSGNIFGTTLLGGTSGSAPGNGMAYKLTAGSSCTEGGVATFLCETDLHNFCSAGPNCTDGDFPDSQLVMDSSGTLYGVTLLGGGSGIMLGEGVAFSLSGVTETVIHSFCTVACTDGDEPGSALIIDSSGTLYGTTESGGDATSNAGVFYQITNP
jgi:uncharacterized repeat protein (TIGR03803 family)